MEMVYNNPVKKNPRIISKGQQKLVELVWTLVEIFNSITTDFLQRNLQSWDCDHLNEKSPLWFTFSTLFKLTWISKQIPKQYANSKV